MSSKYIYIATLIAAALAVASAYLYIQLRRLRRAEFIRDYAWPPGMLDKLQKQRGFRRKESALVAEGLR